MFDFHTELRGYLERKLATNTPSSSAAPKEKHTVHTTWFDNRDLIDINYLAYSNVLILQGVLSRPGIPGGSAF
jgi:hypothetical protein